MDLKKRTGDREGIRQVREVCHTRENGSRTEPLLENLDFSRVTANQGPGRSSMMKGAMSRHEVTNESDRQKNVGSPEGKVGAQKEVRARRGWGR